jgi:hypothetical protein
MVDSVVLRMDFALSGLTCELELMSQGCALGYRISAFQA